MPAPTPASGLSVEGRVCFWIARYREAAEIAERDGRDSTFERGRERFLSRLLLAEDGGGAPHPRWLPLRGGAGGGRLGVLSARQSADAAAQPPPTPSSSAIMASANAVIEADGYEEENAALEANRELRGLPERECWICGYPDDSLDHHQDAHAYDFESFRPW